MGNCSTCKSGDVPDVMGSDDAAKLLEEHDAHLFLNDPASAANLAEKERQTTPEVASAANYQSVTSAAAGELPVQHMQLKKVATCEGFIAGMDAAPVLGGTSSLKQYCKTENEEISELQLQEKLHAFRSRVITNEKFDGQRIIGCLIADDFLNRRVHGMAPPEYLWKERNIVPILNAAVSLAPEQNGVQLMQLNMETFDELLIKAAEHTILGVKVRSIITNPNAVGIKGLIDQQFQVSQRIVEKKLVPVLQPEILSSSPEKSKCEQVLIDVLIDALDRLAPDVKVILVLAIPTTPNLYLPLTRHSNILRVAALSCGYDRSTACKMIRQNVGMIPSFGRVLTDDLTLHQSDVDFSSHLDASCQELYQASHSVDDSVEKTARITEQPGFIVLMTPFSLRPMLSAEEQQSPDFEDKLNQCFKRIIVSDKFNSARVVAMFLTMELCSLEVDGMPASQYLWKSKGVIPLVIFSSQLEPETDGVQLLKIPHNFDETLEQAHSLGAFSVQLRGMINKPDKAGVEKIVEQQFGLSLKMIEKGLLPNIMIEVNTDEIAQKIECEELLLNAILSHLGNLTPEQKVTLTLTMPSKPNLYLSLSEHANTLFVGAASRGYTCADACRKLSDNDKLVGIFGRAFTERLKYEQSDEEIAAVVGDSCKMIHQAVTSVSAKEEQMSKISGADGFVATLDIGGSAIARCLKRYGIEVSQHMSKKDINLRFHQMFTRIVTDDHFSGSRVIGTVISENTMKLSICGLPTAKYLWSQKGTVPFLKIDNGLLPEAHGVQLMQFEAKDVPQLLELLDRAGSSGIFGTKQRSFIKRPDKAGIKAVIDQQLEVARHVWAKGLLPMFHLEIDIDSPEQAACEQMLSDLMLDALERLRSNEKVVLLMTLPTKPNFYLTLMSHPNVVRLVAVSGGHAQKKACKMLKTNVNVIGGFGRGFVEGLSVKHKDKEFAKVLDQSCNAILNSSKSVGVKEEQLIKLTSQDGFFVGFDQDTESMPKMLDAYGIEAVQYSDEASMMEKAHQMHTRMVTNLQMNGSRVLGIILTEYATALNFARLPAAKFLWETMRTVPFMKLDRGLAAEEDGVCLMKEVRHVRQKLDKAIKAGICGTITRSIIRLPSQPGIRALVDQQMQLAKTIIQKSLVPILQIEVDIASPDKAKCERVLVNLLCRELDELGPEQRVIVDVTLPETPGTYDRLVEHPNVIRVAGCSGGYKRREAVRRLEANAGMIASFGRAFAEGLHVTQTEMEFTGTLVRTCKLLYNASSTRQGKSMAKSPSSTKDHQVKAASSIKKDQLLGG